MTTIAVTITEVSAYARTQQHVRFSVPLKLGMLHVATHEKQAQKASVKISDSGSELKFQAMPLTQWHDGSVQWLHIYTCVDIDANESKTLELTIDSGQDHVGNDTVVKSSVISDNIDFAAKLSQMFRGGDALSLLEFNKNNDIAKIDGACSIDINGFRYTALVDEVSHENQAYIGSPLISTLSLNGSFYSENASAPSTSVRFYCEYTIDTQNKHIATAFSIHNPEASEHPAGLWDLGDNNSSEIVNLCFSLASANTSLINLTDSENPNTSEQQLKLPVTLTQLNSGGEHFDCINHVDKNQQVSLSNKGYTLFNAGIEQNGQRISPTFSLHEQSNENIHHLKLQNFWQNFPKSISIDESQCIIDLFPAAIELQPGEKKTHYFEQLFSSAAPTNIAQANLNCTVDPTWIQSTHVLPFFSSQGVSQKLTALVKEEALDGPQNFFAKREMIDEFGWRHFGDLYADHETSRQNDDSIFISHYNNQYDPIYGFMQQYLKDNDARWLSLSDDLAKHVLDIDIYHTTKDKAEYNNGLFWHTDHYNQAHTCTHRTFSKHQSEAAYGNQQGGGGPGGQHCYTSGLMLHYCMTGNQASKQAVFTLTQWITNVYEGSGSIFEFLLRFKNRHFGDYRNVVTNKYPFDRGSANYVTALLDSYYLSKNSDYLDRARNVIQHTISLHDNIDERGLDNPETTWFYIVFLQACARYMCTSRQAKLDQHDGHIHATFCKYVEWMLNNEKPFLESADKLEFVNATWVAQDTRKAWLYDACLWLDIMPEHKQKFKQQSQFFKDYIFDYLKNSEEKHYTRILALLLQNTSAFDESEEPKDKHSNPPAEPFSQEALKYDTFAGNIFKLFKHFSLTREVSWLKKRLR